jgi:hypothetical protein
LEGDVDDTIINVMQKLVMNKLILVIPILGALLIGYLVFGIKEKAETQEVPAVTKEVTVTGAVTAIDRSQRMVDGPTLITISTDEGLNKTIAVPSMGINLCAARERIADLEQLAVGDTMIVRGATDESGLIVPCERVTDSLTVVGKVLDTVYGYEFMYRKGPNGYITLEDATTGHEDYVTGVLLYDTREYESFLASEDVREGPPAIRVRVYQNPEMLSAPVWAMRNKQEVNYQLMIGQESEAVVGGANATHFVTDGLFTTEVYVVAHGAHVYVLMGDYADVESVIHDDFNELVTSFTFVPNAEQLGTGAKIDPQVACESALMYMSFMSGADAEEFVADCVEGKYPEVIERFIRERGLNGAAI